MKIKAYMNHGRWMWQCPDCGGKNRYDFSQDICTHCFPNLLATAKIVRPGQEGKLAALMASNSLSGSDKQRSLHSGRGLQFVDAPDLATRLEARGKAEKMKRVHDVEMPSDKDVQMAMKYLRPRKTENMNWYPGRGETIADLKRQNKEHEVKA